MPSSASSVPACLITAAALLLLLVCAPASGQFVARYYSDAQCSGEPSFEVEQPQAHEHCFEPGWADESWGLFAASCNGDHSAVTLRTRNYDPETNLWEQCGDDSLFAFSVTYNTGACVATDATNDKMAPAAPYQKWLCGAAATAYKNDESVDTVYRLGCASDACEICGEPSSVQPQVCSPGFSYSKKFVCNYAETKVRVQQWTNENCEGDPLRTFEYDVGTCAAVDENEEDITFPNSKWTCGTADNAGGSDGGSAGGSSGGSTGGAGDGGSTAAGDSATDVPSVLTAGLAAAGGALLVAA